MKNENVNWVYKLLLFELIYTVQTTFRLFRFFFWPLYYVKHFFRLLHYAKCLLCSNGHYVHNDHFQSLNLPQRPLSSLFFLLFPPPSRPLHLNDTKDRDIKRMELVYGCNIMKYSQFWVPYEMSHGTEPMWRSFTSY